MRHRGGPGEGHTLRALIIEQGDSRGAVAAVRALARAGWSVGVGSPAAAGLASASRFCRYRHEVPPAHRNVDEFMAAVRRIVGVHGYEVVFGAGEAEVLALSARRDEVAAAIPYAQDAVVRRALDKTDLEQVALQVGFALPATVSLEGRSDGDTPYVVKARQHAAPERPGAPPRIDTNVFFGAPEARRRVAEIVADGAEPIVQEFLDGALVAYAAVADRDSRVVADSMQVASHIWPPFAGASCRAATTAVDEDIATAAQRLFTALEWFGLAELQFVVSAAGRPRLIDFNGRFYGSLALAVAAGANLPAVWAALATGRQARPARARAGVRYQWLEADVRRALREQRQGVVRDVATTVAAAAGAHHSLWEARDPGPALHRLRRLAARR